jgi:hypothetical protein
MRRPVTRTVPGASQRQPSAVVDEFLRADAVAKGIVDGKPTRNLQNESFRWMLANGIFLTAGKARPPSIFDGKPRHCG